MITHLYTENDCRINACSEKKRRSNARAGFQLMNDRWYPYEKIMLKGLFVIRLNQTIGFATLASCELKTSRLVQI